MWRWLLHLCGYEEAKSPEETTALQTAALQRIDHIIQAELSGLEDMDLRIAELEKFVLELNRRQEWVRLRATVGELKELRKNKEEAAKAHACATALRNAHSRSVGTRRVKGQLAALRSARTALNLTNDVEMDEYEDLYDGLASDAAETDEVEDRRSVAGATMGVTDEEAAGVVAQLQAAREAPTPEAPLPYLPTVPNHSLGPAADSTHREAQDLRAELVLELGDF
jgi:hypothetical protein